MTARSSAYCLTKAAKKPLFKPFWTLCRAGRVICRAKCPATAQASVLPTAAEFDVNRETIRRRLDAAAPPPASEPPPITGSRMTPALGFR